MKIEIIVKSVYGSLLYYVKDEEQAKAIQLLTKKKTLSQNAISGLVKLGFEVDIYNPYE